MTSALINTILTTSSLQNPEASSCVSYVEHVHSAAAFSSRFVRNSAAQTSRQPDHWDWGSRSRSRPGEAPYVSFSLSFFFVVPFFCFPPPLGIWRFRYHISDVSGRYSTAKRTLSFSCHPTIGMGTPRSAGEKEWG